MQLLLIHLSDIHVKTGDDPILAQAEKIGSAIRSRNDRADFAVCVIGGDIAFSGKDYQYREAFSFFEKISEAARVPIVFAVTPGNHDLDFDRNSSAREMLIKGILQTPSDPIDKTVIDICIEPQRAFFEFRDRLRDGSSIPSESNVSYEYRYTVGGEHLQIRCVDSAWMSSLHEKPGTLLVPAQFINDMRHEGFTITVFHHPYNWLNPASKPFIRAAERLSDLILTGHEHEHDRTIKYRPEESVAATYIEGAALQEHDDLSNSAFNLLLIDTKAGLYKFYHFSWDGSRYSAQSVVADWETLPLASVRAGERLELSESFSSWLDDSGIPGNAIRGHSRSLSDIFVYPELWESFRDPTLKRKRVTVKSESVYSTLQSQELTFIFGAPKSGRTSLARKLFADFAADGYVPLYLDGFESGMRAGASLPPVVTRQAKIQYGDTNVEAYQQLPRERRVVVVDNADRIKGKPTDVILLIDALTAFAGRVVIIGDDSAGGVTEISAACAENGDGARSFEIQALGYSLREKLAQSWFAETDLDEAEYSRLLERSSQILETIIGRNYVPAYPIYIIAVLQAIEEGGVVDPKASTHGYFYDLLIRQALTVRSETKDVGTRMAFLTHLAYEMYLASRREILNSELRESFKRYDEKYAVGGLEYNRLITELTDRGMLSFDGDIVRFRYPYLYNYFVANHLSRHISDAEVRDQVHALTKNLRDDQASDILMFLAHLSHDLFVIERLLETANGYLAEREPETLETIVKVEEDEVALEFVERPQIDARREAAATKDAQVAKREEAEDLESDAESDGLALEVSSAIHAIRVMGQILKNFPGALLAETKVSITVASSDLGLRLLNVALEKVEADRKDILETIVQAIRRNYPGIPEDKVRARAERYLWVLTIVTSYSLIRLVANALAAPELEPIYDRVFSGKISPARAILNLALRLEVSASFPKGLIIRVADDMKGRRLPEMLVKLLALDYFERIYVAPPVHQSVCAKLGISYRVLPSNKKYKKLATASR